MARLIGGIASSHTPTIGFAQDRKLQHDPVWAPIFEAYEPIKAWLRDRRPDALVVIYNDHITSFFFDHYSPFALGVDDHYAAADEGGGARALPDIKGHLGLARHLTASLMADEFDISTFRDKPLDHGCFSPLSMMAEPQERWPWSIVPLQVGVLQSPSPSAGRCYRLGKALRRAIESYPEDISVAVLATGGLSHQVHGERSGFNNPAWDAEFLDLLETDPESLARMPLAEFARRGGYEGSEVVMWLIMRGALTPRVRQVHRSYYLPSMTAIATAIYEDMPGDTADPPHAAFVDRQTKGLSEIEGTYPFDLARSHKAYRLNVFLHRLVDPAHRQKFAEDPEALMSEGGLSTEEADMVRRRDWRGLIRYGAIFFVLEKLAAVSGVSNPQIYAAMRGETLETFQKTRNANIQYGTSDKPLTT